ncbi:MULTISPECIES: hypothetical protein [Bacillus cereus group]|uniref:Uncharacterized protein n=2 Tax=Bacillus cereus group TaxID=86661 RepID=A0A9W7UNR7_BACCE|nr:MULTISPECIES: hypothetical protein [Bacillus cereus group]KAA6449765.1 hypothetical protein DX932_29595 [Bacillus cereus]MEB9673225.1 hypothetical protein [Bacillus anthracis]OTW50795.1 hypothetical protein BK699_09605 [Bacillus thuringiensis serovar mexicanensis]OTX09480.1 hypothetical protein BK705_04650 [Bacillus thuringiensis serovar monterrey]PEQ70205.1 hypothetical protein CN474_18775 [Bacillus thuringiensis]
MKKKTLPRLNRYSWRRSLNNAREQLKQKKGHNDLQLDSIGDGHVWFLVRKKGSFGITQEFRIKYDTQYRTFEYFEKK